MRCSPAKLLELKREVEFRFYQANPLNFIFSGLLYTKDEHDAATPVKLLPDKPYMRETVAVIHETHITFIPKSRQIMATWLCSAYALWTALFIPYQAILVQSKNEINSAMMVFMQKMDTARISFMYSRLPEWLQERVRVTASYSKLSFGNGSWILGVPEGGDIVRQYTASIVLFDEAGFQPEFESAYAAAKPMAKKIIAVSTMNPGFFADVCMETCLEALRMDGVV